MGKEKPGFLTPKAISNRIKAKGLQKLKWYCQMCNKQCRDENGFKCHTMSESHQRQLLLFAENPLKYMDSFSREFLTSYLDIVRRQFGGKRVHANVVYQEYIKQRDHVHMNSTRWHTLTGLVNWLGKKGICRVDNTEKGWFIEYIEQDPEKKRKEEASARLTATEEMLTQKQIERQIERDKARLASGASNSGEGQASADGGSDVKEFVRPEGLPLRLKLFDNAEKAKEEVAQQSDEAAPEASKKAAPVVLKKNALLEAAAREADRSERSSLKRRAPSVCSSSSSSNLTALDEIMAEEERRKEKQNRREHWLHENIVVKLVSRALEQHGLKGKKAVVKQMVDEYMALVELLEDDQPEGKPPRQLKVDQTHVQTVIPAVGRRVLVVNGAYRGSEAVLKTIHQDLFACDVQIDAGLCRGRVVRVKYEDMSKLAS